MQSPNSGNLNIVQRIVGWGLNSRIVSGLFRLPPVAWLTRQITRVVVRRGLRRSSSGIAAPEHIVSESPEYTLQSIVHTVVTSLGYVGAMVATVEPGDALAVRAFYIDPQIATDDQIDQWEHELSRFAPFPLSISNPETSRVYRYQERYRTNLSIRAVERGEAIVDDSLLSLFTPIIPQTPLTESVLAGIQQTLGIQQVVALPFFIQVTTRHGAEKELVGNLFAAHSRTFTDHDLAVLTAFGRQAAALIENERRRAQIRILAELVYEMQVRLQDERDILQRIARGVVQDLGYVGAMVATLEPGGVLPVKAFFVDPRVASEGQLKKWEEQISRLTPQPLSLSDESIARVYIHQAAYRENLGVEATRRGQPVTSDTLYSLLTPIVPSSPLTREIISGIQQVLEIQQVIAVPFFLRSFVDGRETRELIGNLFAATRSRSFTIGEIDLLTTFGEQAAAGIRNARLYRMSEERRLVAQLFAKMAFSASAYVHELRNHVGAAKTSLRLLQLLDSLDPERRQAVMESLPEAAGRLAAAADILDKLHEPWRRMLDEVIDVNVCLQRCANKLKPTFGDIFTVKKGQNLPPVTVSMDMLTEAIRVIAKNGAEAVQNRPPDHRRISLESVFTQESIQIRISDNGDGIAPENLARVFELGWTTKSHGMGFGLFWTKDFIEGLGGRVEVTSVLGEGTTFTVFIPAQSESGSPSVPVESRTA